MHICFLCNEYPPNPHGGIGSFTQTLGRALAARGQRVTVVGIYPTQEVLRSDDAGVSVIRLPHTRLRGAGFLAHGKKLAAELAALNARHPIDVLEGPELSLANIPPHLARTKVIRMNGGHHFFYTTLGEKPRLWRSWQEKKSFARANRLCAVSQYVAETTRRLLKLGERPIEILPNPVNTQRFCPSAEHREEKDLIVFVGTVCEKKGIRQLIEAMPEIMAAHPAARLLVAGRDWRDPLSGQSFTARLRAALPDHLIKHIEFTGHIDNATLPAILARACVCVYPSHMEAQGIVIVEGLAMGKAVVATQTGPGPELIEHGVSGLLCDPHDPHSIATQVIRALQDAALRRQLGENARRRAVERFSIAALVARNETFYEHCLSR